MVESQETKAAPRASHLWSWSLMQDVIVGRRRCWVLPQHGAVWKFIVDFLCYWYISQQHELLHHGVGLPNSQERLWLIFTRNQLVKWERLLSEDTYKSSFAWRSMGSWVSLSMWKRTSKEDNVRALRRKTNIMNVHPMNSDSLLFYSQLLVLTRFRFVVS